MEEYEEFMFHNDCITHFNNELFSGIFTEENITSPKKAIKIGGSKHFGFFLEKGRERYFALSGDIDQLPFKVLSEEEHDFKNDVYKFILQVEPITIPAQKRMTLREVIDLLSRFKHSNVPHYKLMNIVGVVSHLDRINARISTRAGFGKDSVAAVLASLINSTANLYGATFAKLEYVLINKLIVLNELGNLKKDEMVDMQEFLLATGAYFNTYTKRTRKTSTTQEQYDISNLTLLIFYNLPDYYVNKNQEYFDQMFTKAVTNRFIPFVFDGVLTSKFDTLIDVKNIVNINREKYKDVIATLNWYKKNKPAFINFKVDRSVIKFSKDLMRYDRTFNVIMKYIAEYSNTQEEFDSLSKELYQCYLNYDKLLKSEQVKLK